MTPHPHTAGSNGSTPLKNDIDTIFPPDFANSLVVKRDLALHEIRQQRAQWYTNTLAKQTTDSKLAASIITFAARFLVNIREKLEEEASKGRSSFEVTILDRRETAGMYFATYQDGNASIAAFDLSMMPSEHAKKVRGAALIIKKLLEAKFQVEVSQFPEKCAECFVQEIKIKVTIPKSVKK